MILLFRLFFFLDELQEVLLYVPEVKDISPKATIESLHTLKEIAAKCGYKIRAVPSPNAEEKKEIVCKEIL